MPSFSSIGAENAVNTGVTDGLFSWAAWPHGNTRKMDPGLDASYRHFLGNRPYMVAVSPWFYTNLPTWNKNWAWKGDDLWNDRWNEILQIRPEYVQIVSIPGTAKGSTYSNDDDRSRGTTSASPITSVPSTRSSSARSSTARRHSTTSEICLTTAGGFCSLS